jgi:hypothetical protein
MVNLFTLRVLSIPAFLPSNFLQCLAFHMFFWSLHFIIYLIGYIFFIETISDGPISICILEY